MQTCEKTDPGLGEADGMAFAGTSLVDGATTGGGGVRGWLVRSFVSREYPILRLFRLRHALGTPEAWALLWKSRALSRDITLQL